jgi:hypothetical protein
VIKNTQHIKIEKRNEVKEVNMKQKVINATYRKDSNTFPDWLKYEFEILNEDGTTSKIPAYGKDLQDALSRVVHDKRVVEVEKRTKRIPDLVWVVLWFGYILALADFSMSSEYTNTVKSIVFLSGLSLVTGLTIWAKTWFRMRNRDK